jgi:hypothetical protein
MDLCKQIIISIIIYFYIFSRWIFFFPLKTIAFAIVFSKGLRRRILYNKVQMANKIECGFMT